MKRIGTTSLSIGASLGLLTVAIACSSGGADPDVGGNAGTSTGNTGNTGNTGASGGAGNTGNTAGTGNTGNTAGSGNSGGTAGTSSGGTAGTSSGTGVCTSADSVVRDLTLEPYVDNFETETRWGGWYAFSDTMPTVDIKALREGPGSLETTMAIHHTAMGITTPTSMPTAGYGAGVGFNLVNTTLGEDCVDVSAFDGISFWAKGSSGTANSVIFQVVHPGTQPATSAPPGDCTVPAQCYLHPKKTLTLTADWSHYTVTWAELTGSTFEVTGPILGFNIITPDTEWEIWVDEVTFYSGTAPETPVGPPAAGEGGAGGAAP